MPSSRPQAAQRFRLVLLGLAAILAACSSSAESTDAPDDPTPIATRSSVATPFALPVTPTEPTYVPADPRFEALPGARATSGHYEGGTYRIEVPDEWNGEVVYYAHGFHGYAPELTVPMPPLREYLIERGYAWAASSYRVNGYEPDAGAQDTYALRGIVEEELGVPDRSYLYGQSMGGHVTSLLLEHYPETYDGALSECGVVSGSEILDYFLSWALLSGHFSGIDIAEIAVTGEAWGELFDERILPGLGPIQNPFLGGRAFASTIMHLTGGPRPYFGEGFVLSYGLNFGVLVGAVSNPGGANAAAQNVDTVYEIGPGLGITSEALNREVPRVRANPAYRNGDLADLAFAELTGRIERPYLTLHNTGDLFVPISLEQSYRRAVNEQGRDELLVQRAIRRAGHCNFTAEERAQAFEDLVAWVNGDRQPVGDDLLGDLNDVGSRFTVPLEPDDPGAVASIPDGD